ncbi:hypothetical protein [Haliangium sp.]|uniref:hypothetical protein n=1 Tax=Haliangium sp. TaxID=2663208 RepID=UPI003D151006
MSMRDLRASEMASLSKTWIEPGHPDRLALAAQPALAAYLPHIEATHTELVTLYAVGLNDRLAEIGEQQQGLDVRHDALARGIRNGVQMQIHLSPTPEVEAEWQEIDQHLFPNGLEFIKYSYRETAGHAELFAARLTAAIRERLANIKTTGDASLLDAAQDLIQVARAIGALEHERGQSTEQRLTVARARNKWMRMVLTLQQLIQTLEVSDQIVLDIVARIERACSNAERRNRGGANGDVDEPEDELPEDELPEDVETPAGETPNTEAPAVPVEGGTRPDGMAAAADHDAPDAASDFSHVA